MIFKTEKDLATFAENLGRKLEPPLVFELIGDVGAGKTTFTRYLAKGLGVKDSVTSPTFTISNRYQASAGAKCDIELIHYDFYRLENPGLMKEELTEALKNQNAIIVLEWANTVKDLLPEDHVKITFRVLENGSRKLIFGNGEAESLFWRRVGGYDRPAPWDAARAKPDDTAGNLRPTKQTIDRVTSLYLDTSSFTAVSRLENESGETFEYEDNLGRNMAEKLLETLESHLKEHGKTWKDLKKITFMSGPGSFTGLRIGACVVNTLAHELNIPLYDHKGKKHPVIIPDYGRPANISTPKK